MPLHYHQKNINICGHIKNITGKDWYTVWITYHNGVTSIYFHFKNNWYKDVANDVLRISWNNSRALLERATFSEWDDDNNN